MISVEALILFVRIVLLVVEQVLLLDKNVVIFQVIKKVTLRLLYNNFIVKHLESTTKHCNFSFFIKNVVTQFK